MFSNVFHFPYVIGLTPCQARQKLSTGLLGEFVPKCKSDGSFEPVQFHEGYYWCVDADGKEVNGTRKHLQKPTCAAQLKSGNFETFNSFHNYFHYHPKWNTICTRYSTLTVCLLSSIISGLNRDYGDLPYCIYVDSPGSVLDRGLISPSPIYSMDPFLHLFCLISCIIRGNFFDNIFSLR